MPQLSLVSCCVIASLAACVLLAQAGPNRRYQGAGPSGYGQRDRDGEYYRRKEEYKKHDGSRDGPGYEHEEYRSYSEHESYEGRGDGPGHYHREEHYEGGDGGPGGYYHKEEHHNKLDVKTFTMQEVTRRGAEVGDLDVYTSTFRCSKPEDEPDFCLHPSYPDRYEGNHDSSDLLEDVLAENNAATCTWANAGLGGCPPHILDTCFAAAMNCTITTVADECGCPYKGGVMFMMKGYLTNIDDANSCVEEYNPPVNGGRDDGRRRLASVDASSYGFANATIYNGTAWIFRGKIDSVVTREGPKQVKGSVTFVSSFATAEADQRRQQNVKKKQKNTRKAKKLDVPAGAAGANYEDGPEYYDSDRSSGYSGERPDYSPERDYEDDYGRYGGKTFIKGGSLKVTILEAMHY